ncbi:hypothetical protein PJI17_30770 [Mycobacterium kansasii]
MAAQARRESRRSRTIAANHRRRLAVAVDSAVCSTIQRWAIGTCNAGG